MARVLSLTCKQEPPQKMDLDLRLKIAVLGPPLSGASTVATKLGEEFNLTVIQPQNLAETTSQQAESEEERKIFP